VHLNWVPHRITSVVLKRRAHIRWGDKASPVASSSLSTSLFDKLPLRSMPAPIIRLGVVVPSSNTALEPLTSAIISSISTPERPITVHYTRIPVTQLNLSSGSSAQFSHKTLLAAAKLLADAKVRLVPMLSRVMDNMSINPANIEQQVTAIGWSGTSAGWLGFPQDEELCRLISEQLGVPATTSTLALNRVLKFAGVKKLGLVTPYTDDVNQAIIKNYSNIGYNIHRERHLSITENTDIVQIPANVLGEMVREVAVDADAVTTFCTNLNSAHLVDGWEKELGIPVFDSVATVVWDLCRMSGIDMSSASNWGRMFF
jgi:maleate isomerase